MLEIFDQNFRISKNQKIFFEIFQENFSSRKKKFFQKYFLLYRTEIFQRFQKLHLEMHSSTPARVIECLSVFPLYSNKSFEFRARLSMILCISKKKIFFSSTSEAPISELRWNLGTNLVSGSNYTVRRLDWKRF